MKVFIVNDTSLLKKNGVSHFGCSLVMETYREQCARIGAEIVGTSRRDDKRIAVPHTVDLVIVNGEGSIHHGLRSHLVKVATRHPSVLVNAVWQDNPSYPELRQFKYIAVRESLSQQAMPDDLNVEIVPDIMFASTTLTTFRRTQPEDDLGLTDSVEDTRGISARSAPEEYLSGLARYRRLCVGRFHAAVAAASMGIPFAAWPSNTHKTRGLLTDMGIPHLYFETREAAIENTPHKLDHRIGLFVIEARKKIIEMFDGLHQFA